MLTIKLTINDVKFNLIARNRHDCFLLIINKIFLNVKALDSDFFNKCKQCNYIDAIRSVDNVSYQLESDDFPNSLKISERSFRK